MRFLFLCLILPLLLFICVDSSSAQPDISYVIPDIGAAGMNTYVEIVARHDANGSFGADGFYLNNSGDAVRVEPIGSLANKVVVGPIVVSWNGRLISTQVFVKPDATIGTGELRVTTSSGSDNVNFEIVTPQSTISSPGSGALGSGGAFGTRSKRGAMIVESLSLFSGSYTFSTSDPDNGTAGNQGYLPFIIIAKNAVNIGPITLNASGSGRDGGPGGGGGGGQVCDAVAIGGGGASGTTGGNGFTGGGGGGRNNAGVAIGSRTSVKNNAGTGSGNNGTSLNGVPAGLGSAECVHPEGAGGGTGHPFGRGGENRCQGSNGHYGGGGTGGQNTGGGGGGYGADGGNGSGTETANTRGRIHGNSQLVPIAGGSGGASGNPQAATGGCAGTTGGGGGAIAIYSMGFLSSQGTMRANGAAGQDGNSSSDGGGGSGGAIVLGTKMPAVSRATGLHQVAGGNAGGSGAGAGSVGRGRHDGFLTNQPVFTGGSPVYIGPTTDTLTYTDKPTFTVSGTRDASSTIRVYMRSESGSWSLQPNPTYNGREWSLDLTPSDGAGNYYIAAFQQVASPSNGQYTAEPSWVTSQVAANIVEVDAVPEIEIVSGPNFTAGTLTCPGQTDDFVFIRFISKGSSDLHVRAVLGGANAGDFSIISPVGITGAPPGLTFPPSLTDTVSIVVRFNPSAFGTRRATITLFTDDPRSGLSQIGPIDITGILLRAETSLDRDTLDLGQVCADSATIDSAWVRFIGNQPFAISSISALRATSPFSKVRPVATPASFRNPLPSETVTDSIPLVFRFQPRSTGLFIDSVTIIDACDVEHTLYLKGEGVFIDVEFDPAFINFAASPVGQTKNIPLTIRNNGDSPARITGVRIEAPTQPFSFPPSLVGAALPAADSIVTNISFTPDSTIGYDAFLIVTIDGPCGGERRIRLSGFGVEVNLVPDKDSLLLAADTCSTEPDPLVTDKIVLRNLGTLGVRLEEVISKNGKLTLTAQPALPTTITTHSVEFSVEWRPSLNPPGTDSIGIVWNDTTRGTIDTLWIPVTLQFDRAIVRLLSVDGTDLPSVIDIGGAYQCAPARDTIVLQNAGTIEGLITGGFVDGTNFRVVPAPPYTLNVNQSLSLEILFDAATLGDYIDTLVLRNGRCDQEWRVAVRASRYDLAITSQGVNFGATNLGLTRNGTARLTNATLNAPPTEEIVVDRVYIDPPGASPPFMVENPPTFPVLVPTGETFEVEVSFTPPQPDERTYNGRLCFEISEPCDTIICVDLTGEGINSNIYVPQADLSFGEVYNCQEDTLDLQIYSVGPEPLRVDSLRIIGPDRLGFEILSINPTLPFPMRPGLPSIQDSIEVSVRFIPNNVPPDGVKNATLEIYSNDPKQGLLAIPLTGERTSPQIVGPALVDYGTVVVSGSSRLPITLTNTSNDPITITNPTVGSPFRLLTATPLVIPPNSSIEIDVEFTPDASQTYNDTLVGLFSLPCNGEMRIPLTGEGLQSETIIAVPTTITGQPGEEILIPIVLEEAEAIADVGATTLRLDVRFNGSMLLPVDVQFTNGTTKAAAASGQLLSSTLQGNDRVAQVELKNDPLPASPDTLGWLRTVVLLGNDITTSITLENPTWTDGAVVTSTRDGEFTLHGYCTVGGDRLLRVEGLFGIKAVAPNPFAEETEIQFETVENGKTVLEVYDIHGRRVAALLDLEDLPVQAHIATWNASQHPPGIYYAVLTTPTQRSVKRMVVVQ